MVFFSSRISPLTSTVIFCERSPLATAVVTSAMLRTWSVRLRGQHVDVVGQVLPRAGDALDLGLAAELALGADLLRDARHLGGERAELIDHRVDRVLELAGSRPRASTVIFCDRSPLATAVVTFAMLRTCAVRFAGQAVDVVGQVLPRAGRRRSPRPDRRACLRCRPPCATRVTSAANGVELVDHRVDGVLQLEDLALARRR